MNDILYFQYSIFDVGNQLWRSDGTEAGTWMLKQISNYYVQAYAWIPMWDVEGKLYFLGKNPDNYDHPKLWVSDGTSEGTRVIEGDTDYQTTDSFLEKANDRLFFWGYDALYTQSSLWVYNLRPGVAFLPMVNTSFSVRSGPDPD